MSTFTASRYPAALRRETRAVTFDDLRIGQVVVWPDGSRARIASLGYGLHPVIRFARRNDADAIQYAPARGERIRIAKAAQHT